MNVMIRKTLVYFLWPSSF